MKTLETPRLIIRAFRGEDLETIHALLGRTFDDPMTLEERRAWLEWSQLSEIWLDKLYQPPYGDRAVTLKSSGELIGSVGLVPLLAPFGQIPDLRSGDRPELAYTPEIGLFWVIDTAHQRRGYASEAARALVDFAFTELRLKRILATTEYDNLASQSVMLRLGMTLTHNPLPDPAWMQVVGILNNRRV